MKNEYEIRGETTVIFLRRKDGIVLETLIDTGDFPLVSRASHWASRWDEDIQGFYCQGRLEGKYIQMHRLLLLPSRRWVVDHINHDGLDNRRSNLRCVSATLNQLNRKSAARHNSTGVLGVRWQRRDRRYRATVVVEGKVHDFGSYTDLDAARNAVEIGRANIVAMLLEDSRHVA